MQRANAYLDHYYIIMGYPEEYNDRKELLTSFLKIPVTDKCKLIPATGVYAVSVKTGMHVSRGMAVIIKETGVPEVLVHIFEDQGRSTGKLTEVLFHKMIRGTVAFSDPSARHRLESAKAEISELIF
jgi:FAD synthase